MVTKMNYKILSQMLTLSDLIHGEKSKSLVFEKRFSEIENYLQTPLNLHSKTDINKLSDEINYLSCKKTYGSLNKAIGDASREISENTVDGLVEKLQDERDRNYEKICGKKVSSDILNSTYIKKIIDGEKHFYLEDRLNKISKGLDKVGDKKLSLKDIDTLKYALSKIENNSYLQKKSKNQDFSSLKESVENKLKSCIEKNGKSYFTFGSEKTKVLPIKKSKRNSSGRLALHVAATLAGIFGIIYPLQTNSIQGKINENSLEEKMDYASKAIAETLFPTNFANNLESKIKVYVEKQEQKGIIKSGEKTAWVVEYLGDMDDGIKDTPIKLVSINDTISMQTASMVKPLIALSFFHKVKQGELKYDEKSKVKMEEMIEKSNNKSTEWVMNQIGGPEKVQEILSKNYGEILQHINIVEYIPINGRTYLNKASANDYSCFLSALWNKEKFPYSEEILRLMALPNKDRLYDKVVPKLPDSTIVYDKTGTTSKLCGNTGILVIKDKKGHKQAYTLTGIIERNNKNGDLSSGMYSRGDVIRGVSGIVYAELKKQLDLK